MDRITRMLAEESDDDNNDNDVVDDSDAKPDFVLPNERHNSDESYSDLEKEPIIMSEPQLILQDSVVEPVEAEEVIPSPNLLPSHVFGRLQKNEYGPVYCWSTKEPPTAVRTPAHNVIRGLPGLTAHSRSLGDRPDIRAVWELLFDDHVGQSDCDLYKPKTVISEGKISRPLNNRTIVTLTILKLMLISVFCSCLVF